MRSGKRMTRHGINSGGSVIGGGVAA